jgi:hypothetical protein
MLTEGLQKGDLSKLVRNEIHIDEYSSKMGEDRDVITVSFKVSGMLPAKDLVDFIERGYSFVLDADVAAGELSDGDYLVFVEFERTPEFPAHMKSILYGVRNLANIDNWEFSYKGGEAIPCSTRVITATVPLTADEYDVENNVDAGSDTNDADDLADDTFKENLNKFKDIAHVPQHKTKSKSFDLHNNPIINYYRTSR